MALGEATVPIRATLDKLDGDLNEAKGKINGALSGLGKTTQLLGGLAYGGIAAGIGLVAGGFGLAAREAIGMNSTLETSQLQFATLMGDAEAAEAHVASLFEFAKKTPFETGPIIEASRMLQTFGGNALNTEENLTLVGDAAAAVSAPFDELGFWVGRAYSAIQGGQPFGEAAMRLQELAVLSPEARKQMEDLQAAGASADEVWGIFEQDLGRFTGAMETQAGTWQGLTSTISDTLSLTAATALRPFFDLAKDGLAGLVDFVSGETFTGWVDQVAGLMDGATTSIGLFFDRMGGGMPLVDNLGALVSNLGVTFGMSGDQARALGDSLAGVLSWIQETAGQIWSLIEPVVQAASEFVSWKDVLIAVGAAIAAFLLPIIASIIAAVFPLIATFALIVGAVALLRNAWESNWGGIQEKVQAVIDFIVPFVNNAIAAIQAWWAANGEAILAGAAAAWEAVRAAIQSAIEAVQNIVRAVLARIQSFWQEHGDSIRTIAQAAMDAIRGIIESVTGFIVGIWERFGGMLIANAQTAWDMIKNIVDAAINVVGEIIDAVAAAITGDWEAFGESLQNAATIAWDAIKEHVALATDALKRTVETVTGAIGDAWDAAMGAIQEATQPAIDLINGIKEAAQGFWNWLKGKVFDFDIKIPSLPDWATPGSPLPIHTAWKAFANDLNNLTVRPRFDLDALAPAVAFSGATSPAHAGGGTTINVTANYPYQSERSLVQDLRVLEALRS